MTDKELEAPFFLLGPTDSIQKGDIFWWEKPLPHWETVLDSSSLIGRKVVDARGIWSELGAIRRILPDPVPNPFREAGYSWATKSLYPSLLPNHAKAIADGYTLLRVGEPMVDGTIFVDTSSAARRPAPINSIINRAPIKDSLFPHYAPPPKAPKEPIEDFENRMLKELTKDLSMPDSTDVTPPKSKRIRASRTRKGMKRASLDGAKGIGAAFVSGAKGAGANESIRFLIAGLRRAGTWHPLLDAPNLAPVVEVVLPALLGIALGTFEGQVPYAGEASEFLLLAAQEPARRLGADAIHHFGTLARAVILQDEKALDGALKAMLPASTAPSFTDFIPQGGEKECVASSTSSSSSSSLSSPPPVVAPLPTP